MKKFVSAIAALAVVTAMAVPTMAATEAEVIAALQNAGVGSTYVDAAKTYLNSVELSASTLDTVVANISTAKDAAAKKDSKAVMAAAKAAQTAINEDSGAASNKIEFVTANDGDVSKVVVKANGISVGVDVKDGVIAPINTLTPSAGTGSNSGSTASNPVKATGASMNVTAAMTAALAMAASMGAAVVYSVKKGLLAK